MQVDAAQVGKEALQDHPTVLYGCQVVVGHHKGVQAGEDGAQLAYLLPVMETVVGDVQQAQRRAGRGSGQHTVVLVAAQEQLLKPSGGN